MSCHQLSGLLAPEVQGEIPYLFYKASFLPLGTGISGVFPPFPNC